MDKLKGIAMDRQKDFLAWMDGACSAFDEMSDGAWQACCENMVEVYNREHGTRIDPFDGWMAWAESQSTSAS